MPEIHSGEVWKKAENEWISVAEVRGDDITGRLRVVPPATTSDWTGSRADFENYELARKWKVGANCERWDDGDGKRALGEHWIEYEGAHAGREIRLPPPPTSPTGVDMSVLAVTAEEAKARVEAALAQAGAGCTDCHVR